MPRLLCAVAVALVLAPAASAAQPDPLRLRLDSLARAALASEPLAGVSVAVLRGRDTLLLAGYGHADLAHRVPATPRTTYHLIGPGGLVMAALLMQEVEAGRLRLDDDASALLPEFPWQGRRVTVRQLMDATSGLPDFHYLGDPFVLALPVPKAPDEVTALFAGRPFVHAPGERWEWTISGYHLAGLLLERLTGTAYPDLVRDRVFSRAGLAESHACGDRGVVPALAQSYTAADGGFVRPNPQTASMYPFTATTCATAGDVASLVRALRDGRLMRRESYGAMATAEGAAQNARIAGLNVGYGLGLVLGAEEAHRWVGGWGSLMGYNSSVLDFPADSLTVAVLSNTEGQAAFRLSRQLARAALGLSLPAGTPPAQAAGGERDLPLSAAERARYVGTWRVRLENAPPRFQQYVRTYRVFEQNGRLMLQPLGQYAERMLALGDDRFVLAGSPDFTVHFTVRDGRAVEVVLPWGEAPTAPREVGVRVEDALAPPAEPGPPRG